MENKPEQITISLKEYQDMRYELAFLRHEMAELKRMIFGSKSERFVSNVDASQLTLFGQQTLQQAPAAPEPVKHQPQVEKHSTADKKRPVRGVISPALPRRTEIIEPAELNEYMRKIGEEITEILEYEAGKIYVRCIVRPKYVSTQSEIGVTIAPLPSLPLPKSNAGASILAHIMVSKFVDHLPYYRQIEQFKRQGIELSESTINGWFGNVSKLLTPLYDTLVTKVQSQTYLMADETPIPVQDRAQKGATHRGYHWLYYAPLKELVCFDYRTGRGREGPINFLNQFKGTLQTDGYAAYNYFDNKPGVTLLACMAHARRYFEQAQENDAESAQWMLLNIQKLYALERKAHNENYSALQRYELRQTYAKPILDEIKTWLDQKLVSVLPKSPIGKAVQYTLSLWNRLVRYIDHGQYEIDNNWAENSIRPIALGRKNYLFAGSHQGAHNAAMFYSFLATCKRNKVNSEKWLKYVIENIAEHKANKLDELLPNHFTEIFPAIE